MNIFLTLDYELFSGSNPGSVENSIITPTRKLLEIGDKHGVKFVFFVDSGYIRRLSDFTDKYPLAKRDFDAITKQIKELHKSGHDIELHIHPHWEDCTYDENGWHMDTTRFRIHSFGKEQIEDIVRRYKKTLTDIIEEEVFAYRAGGWCLQPFDKLKDALKENNIWLDSTVYEGGYNSSKTHYYDFRNFVKKSFYRFEDDPVIEKEDGFFVEIPISTHMVSPLFFWQFAYYKKFGKNEHKVFSDGITAGGTSGSSMLRMLTKYTKSIVSMDGYRAKLLKNSLDSNAKNDPEGNFVVIGHPKALTPYSLEKLDQFLRYATKNHTVTTFSKFCKNNGINLSNK